MNARHEPSTTEAPGDRIAVSEQRPGAACRVRSYVWTVSTVQNPNWLMEWVYGRARIELYRDADYRGQRLRIERDAADLGAINWGDQISSFHVR